MATGLPPRGPVARPMQVVPSAHRARAAPSAAAVSRALAAPCSQRLTRLAGGEAGQLGGQLALPERRSAPPPTLLTHDALSPLAPRVPRRLPGRPPGGHAPRAAVDVPTEPMCHGPLSRLEIDPPTPLSVPKKSRKLPGASPDRPPRRPSPVVRSQPTNSPQPATTALRPTRLRTRQPRCCTTRSQRCGPRTNL